MDPNVLTISLNRWMSLPDLDIRQWEMLIESEQFRNTNSIESESYYTFHEKSNACKTASRISVGTVAAYYKDYVRIKRLEQYFRWLVSYTNLIQIARESYRVSRVMLITWTLAFQRDYSDFGENSL